MRMDLQLRLKRIADHFRRAAVARYHALWARFVLEAAEARCLPDHLDRVPRNRQERRRLATTGIARSGGSSHSPVLSLHRQIERDQRRQEERFLQGRHVWG